MRKKQGIAALLVLALLAVCLTGFAAMRVRGACCIADRQLKATQAPATESTPLPQASPAPGAEVSVLEAPITASSYPELVVEVGVPVSVNFKAAADTLNGCNNEILMPEFAIDQKLAVGDNVVTFTPSKTGEFPYFCWMGMIQSKVTVVEKGALPGGAAEGAPATSAPAAGNALGITYVASDGGQGNRTCCDLSGR